MATTTPRIGLTKPDGTDLVDIAVLNTNFDKIDSNIASTKIQSTKPTTANAGDLWWDSDTGTLYLYYTDANSSQWVAATSDPINIGVVANQSDRDAQYPSPQQGMKVFRKDTNNEEIYDGSSWVISSSLTGWTAYTPSFSNITIGNGGYSFYYKQVGKTVFVRGRIIWQSTTVFSGASDFSLPTGLSSTTPVLHPVGAASYEKGALYEGWVLTIGGNWCRFVVSLVSGTRIVNQELTNANPFTWASGNQLFFQLCYEAS